MAFKNKIELQSLYAAMQRFVDAALRHDDSLFTPGDPIWSTTSIDDFYERLVLRPDESRDSFETKLHRQLQGAPRETIQFAAEILYVHLLTPRDITGQTKRRIINAILQLSPTGVTIPSDLDRALETGFAKTGVAFKTHRPGQIRFLLEFIREWKRLSSDKQTSYLDDPWAFKAFLWTLPLYSAFSQREALLYLVQPETFEDIVSQDHKRRIASAFSGAVANPTDDVDRQLLQIRQKLSAQYGEGFSYYGNDLESRWHVDARVWDAFVGWAKKFIAWPRFDVAERDYKLEVARNLRSARQAVLNHSADWLSLLRKSFGKPNNLTDWRMNDTFLKWCAANPDAALAALTALWRSEESPARAIDQFGQQVPSSASKGQPLILSSFLLMALDPLQYPIYRRTPVQKAVQLTGYADLRPEGNTGRLYEDYLGFLDRIMEEASARGVELRDRLDAQGIIWSLTQWKADAEPISTWSGSERRAFLKYRGEIPQEDGEGGPEAPKATSSLSELATRLLFSEAHLQRIDQLLQAKKQLIFYGPPGTGKTYVARELAAVVAGDRERVQVVQFHPSYAYEDFVEGYRPRGSQFVLVPGPLKRLAQWARENLDLTYVLLIDEINRGNIAKVFGELYYLLEYRDEQIRLQYSEDELFSLPGNLLILGTMNTADRSIALVDAALRRRFYFVPFFPDEPPIQGLLERWLKQHHPDLAWVAGVVDEANRRLGERHLAIGPSYFMRPDLDEQWVDLIWSHAILPYLAEQFYGDEKRLDDFSLQVLRQKLDDPSAR